MIAQAAVHTTGVNWDQFLTNAVAITFVASVIGGLVARSVKRSIKDQIKDVIDSEVTPLLTEIRAQIQDHGQRLAHLEGVEEGKAQAIAAASVTTTKG